MTAEQTTRWQSLAGIRLFGAPLAPGESSARIHWFIRLRWLAATGVMAFAVGGRLVFRLQFPVAPFVLIGVGIGLYNIVFLLLARRYHREPKWGSGFASLQVAVDLVVLTVLMHFGGGIENPFISYFLFHTIITAFLLPGWQVILQVLFASVCISGLVIAESVGALSHRHIGGLMPVELCSNWKFVAIALFAFITTLSVTAFLAASMASRLHERETDLAQANAVLAEQDRVKSQYVMRVAHDLAGPAGMITSCLKLVTQGLTGPVPEKALDMVQRAESKSEYLGHLIRDLLSLSRIKAVKDIPKSQVVLGDVVDQVFEELRPRARQKKLTLGRNIPDSLPRVYGNADAMHELLANLVTNAVKYTPLGGKVDVFASVASAQILVEVKDNGAGIPADALPHIFEEFYRAENVKAEAVEGTGLGLSIVIQILNAHDGTIWVESEEGEGTTFFFTLPISGETNA